MVPCAVIVPAREVLPGGIMVRRATVHALQTAQLRDMSAGVALRAECKAIADELASCAHTVPEDAQMTVRIEQARQRQLGIAEELRQRG
jgi:hypothetical protein